MKITELFEFEWWVDPLGYDLREDYDLEPFIIDQDGKYQFDEDQREMIEAGDIKPELIIVRKGPIFWKTDTGWERGFKVRLQSYRPFECTAIYRRFVEANTPTKMHQFITRFGLPGTFFRSRITCSWAEKRRQEFERAIATVEDGKTGEFRHGGLKSHLTINFRRDEDKQYRMGIAPEDLYSMMWLQFALDKTRNAQIRRCPTCGNYFEYGPGSGRRSTAIYCKDTCRAAAHYARRTQGNGK